MIARLLISPDTEKRVREINKLLSVHFPDIATNHPDLLYIKAGDKLGIAEARKVKEHYSLKPYSAAGRVVVLEDASVLTIEAQNALLKTLEELPQEAVLILGAESEGSFLPTILSRCQIIRDNSSNSPAVSKAQLTEDIEKLLSATIEERFGYIEKLKNKEEFLTALVSYFRLDLPRNKSFLAKLLQAEEWAKQNVNIRAILEYLMLVMPGRR